MSNCSCCDEPILHEGRLAWRACANCGLAVHADGCMELDGWRRDAAGDTFCNGCGWQEPPASSAEGRG